MEREMERVRSSMQWMVVVVFLAVLWGVLTVYSASYPFAEFKRVGQAHFAIRQGIYALIGGLMALWAMHTDYRRLPQRAKLLVVLTVAALAAVFSPLGTEYGEAKRGLKLGVFVIQPSEFAKVTLVLYLASYLSRFALTLQGGARVLTLASSKTRQMQWTGTAALNVPSFWRIFGVLLHGLAVTGLVSGLVFLQPHLSGAFILAALGFFMLFLSGARISHLALLLMMSVLVVFPLGRKHLRAYQEQRVKAALSSEKDPLGQHYQSTQAKLALGSGGVKGKGFCKSTVKHLYLPAAHTDFIFAILGEEFGFLGTSALIAFYVVLVYFGFHVAYSAKEQFGALLAGGLSALFALHALLHIGVVLGILPTTGVTLPFFSAGGSSLVANLISFGLILNVLRNRFIYWETKSHESRPVRRGHRRARLSRAGASAGV